MQNAIRNIAVLAGVAALAGGGAFYIATRQAPGPAVPAPVSAPAPAPLATTPPSQAATVQEAAAPPPDTTPAPVSQPEPDPAVWPGGVVPEKFVAFARPFTLIRDSAAYSAASGDAPQLYPLKSGTALITTEKSTDGKWVISMTEDGRAAFLLAADLGPYDPARQPAPDLVQTLDGPAQVVDTATLTINGQTVTLGGVSGLTGIYADKLQKVIDANGSTVSCTLLAQSYLCKLPNGLDIARSLLFNGAARASDDASPDYRQQEASAKSAHRGIWN